MWATRDSGSKLQVQGDDLRTLQKLYISDRERKRLEKLQSIRVKFLRLVQRSGLSADDDYVAAEVLHRLGLVAGRETGEYFSLNAAKQEAIQLENEVNYDLGFCVNILAIGKSGVGKSATINSIFGEEKSVVNAFQPGTSSVKEICGVVDGVMVRVFDTPGLRASVMEQGFNRNVLSSAKKLIKKYPLDVVLYVDRLDAQNRDYNDVPLLKSITSSLGPSIWRNAIIILTHGASMPPEGPNGVQLSYETYVNQRSYLVQQAISHAVGDLRMRDPSLVNRVSLVENHGLCRTNHEGQKVLPNGEVWMRRLLVFCYSLKVLAEGDSLKEPQERFGVRRILGFRARCPLLPDILSLMLQSRAHPNLSSEQSCDGSYSGVNDMNRRVSGYNLAVLPKDELPLSFDSDDCAYRFRCTDPSSRSQDGPVFDTDVWDRECGYDGVGLKQTVAIGKRFPASVSVKMTKNKKDFNLGLDSSVSIKHGKNSTMAGFDIQPIGKQLAYIVRGETEYKDFKSNKSAIGMQVMFLGQKTVMGIKHARQITLGKQYSITGAAGNVWFKSDFANEAKIEVQHHGQVQSTLGLSVKEWKGDFASALNTLARFSAGPNSKVSVRAEINNMMNGQISIKTNSSEHLSLALAAIIPVVISALTKMFPSSASLRRQ